MLWASKRNWQYDFFGEASISKLHSNRIHIAESISGEASFTDPQKEFAVIATAERPARNGPNPLHGMLLAGAFPLFLGAALSDYAYFTTYQIQWSHFASWLIAGGLVFCDLALICALIGIFRPASSELTPNCWTVHSVGVQGLSPIFHGAQAF